MSLSAKVGSFSQPTSTGSQSVSGLGFQPKALIFFGAQQTSDSSSASFRTCLGFAASSSQRASTTASSNNSASAVNNNFHACRYSNTDCIQFENPNIGTLSQADFTSMDSDGFTLNWTTADATQRIINYLALGGTDITNVKVGTFTKSTTNGNQSITGVGFQPDHVMFMGMISTLSPPQAFTSLVRQIGFISNSVSRQGIIRNNTSGSVSIVNSVQDASVLVNTNNSDAIANQSTLVSMDSDGFTLNWGSNSGTAIYVFYIAIKGVSISVGSFDQPSSTGNQSITGVGFQPKALLLRSLNFPSSSSVQQVSRDSLGAGTSSSERGCIWIGSSDAVSTSVVHSDLDRTKIIKLLTEGTPTLNAAADLTSMDSDGFTLNWTTADATPREIQYLAFGNGATPITSRSPITFITYRPPWRS